MGEENFRQQYNAFILELLKKEKEPEFSGEEGREKLLKWIRDYFWTDSPEALEHPEPPEALKAAVGEMVEEAIQETVKEMSDEAKTKN